MKDGICPKCKSGDVYQGSSAEGEGLTAGTYSLLVEALAGETPTSFQVDTYICCACGYLEIYIANREHLAIIPHADGWTKPRPTTLPDHPS